MATIKDDAIRVLAVLGPKSIPFALQKAIAAIAMHESANFTSNVYLQNNNAFGMRMPTQRKSPYIVSTGTLPPASEGVTPYAKYKNVEDSVLDFLHLMEYQKLNWNNAGMLTYKNVVVWMKEHGYYTDSTANYANAVGRWIDTMNDILTPVLVAPNSVKKKWWLIWWVWAIFVVLTVGILYLVTRKKTSNGKRKNKY